MKRRHTLSTALIVALILAALLTINLTGAPTFARKAMQLESRLRALTAKADSQNNQEAQILFERAELKQLRDENERLRLLLNFFRTKKYRAAIANVISRDPLNTSLLYLDQGTRDSLKVGQPVVTANGILIGKIIRIAPDTALVELLTNDSSRVAVTSLDTEAQGLLRGSLGSSIFMEYIQKEKNLAASDLIVTSGLEPLIPYGLLVGTVLKVNEKPSELFLNADVQPAADLTSLRVVAVIRTI